jgi:uncharacterized membrane-anchored protein
MSYITEFEKELSAKLNSAEGQEAITKWIYEKILESYKNGIAAGKKRGQCNPNGKNRASGSATQAN